MQTKLQIEQLLSSSGVRPNKRFGQHFLIDLNLMRLLLDTAQLTKDDIVFEVGCATGSMTEGIAEKAGFCVAVEIDTILANIARNQLADFKNVEIIAADALKNKFEINPVVIDAIKRSLSGKLSQNCHPDPERAPIYRGESNGEGSGLDKQEILRCAQNDISHRQGRFFLISNLPYAAGTPIMLNLVTGSLVADAMFVTVQKEVAHRMLAGPGTKDYGILSILLSATGDIKHIRTLKPTVFWPQPQVDSAMISYVRNAEKIKQVKSIETLGTVAGGLLQHRRKMLKSCCKLLTGERGTGFQPVEEFNWPSLFEKCNINPSLRPDHLTVQQFVALANLCSELV